MVQMALRLGALYIRDPARQLISPIGWTRSSMAYLTVAYCSFGQLLARFHLTVQCVAFSTALIHCAVGLMEVRLSEHTVPNFFVP